MQFGTLATFHKKEPAGGPPFPANAANNGLSVDMATGDIVLGNDEGLFGTGPAALFSNREIWLADSFIRFLGQGESDPMISYEWNNDRMLLSYLTGGLENFDTAIRPTGLVAEDNVTLETGSVGAGVITVSDQRPIDATSAAFEWLNDFDFARMHLNSTANSTDPNLLEIDNSRLPGDISMFTSVTGRGNLRAISGAGIAINGGTGTNNPLDINGPFNTNAPSGGTTTSGDIQLGSIKVAAVALDTTRYWEINVNGTVRKVLVGV